MYIYIYIYVKYGLLHSSLEIVIALVGKDVKRYRHLENSYYFPVKID